MDKRKAPKVASANATRLSHELTPEQRDDIEQAFQLLAEGKQHTSIHTKDLKVALRALGFEPHEKGMKKIISEVDNNSMSNTLTKDEFVKIMQTKLFEFENDEEIEHAFPLFTQGKGGMEGKITLEDLRRVADELGENLGDEVLEEMIQEADVDDHDGMISWKEFKRVMKRENAY